MAAGLASMIRRKLESLMVGPNPVDLARLAFDIAEPTPPVCPLGFQGSEYYHPPPRANFNG